jgi:hypothetical protein
MANTLPVLKSTLFLALLSLLAPACGKEIGDSCSTNVDCAQDGTRDCDLSQPGGYCTVNGCDELSCPSEAFCIRIFPYEVSRPTCLYADARFCPIGTGVCRPDSTCGCTQDLDCTSDGLCVPDVSNVPDVPNGYCVPRTSERRYCLRSCGNNGDCRGGYVCRAAGIEGSTPVTNTYGSIAFVPYADTSRAITFCAPAP